MADYPYRWYWRRKHGDRRGQPCRVWARGTMNSIGVEFPDGFRTVTARHAIRKAPQKNKSRPFAQQLELDGGVHDLAPSSERVRLFKPAPAQLPGQTYIDTPTGKESNGGHE
jgi:hypothetical protein